MRPITKGAKNAVNQAESLGSPPITNRCAQNHLQLHESSSEDPKNPDETVRAFWQRQGKE